MFTKVLVCDITIQNVRYGVKLYFYERAIKHLYLLLVDGETVESRSVD